MNLQENIRRILREEVNVPPYVKRRLYIANEYIDSLEPHWVCLHWSYDEGDEYVNETMSEMIRNIIDFSKDISDDEYSEKYNEIYGILISLNYHKQVRDFFYDSLNNCDPKKQDEVYETVTFTIRNKSVIV